MVSDMEMDWKPHSDAEGGIEIVRDRCVALKLKELPSICM